MTYGSSPPPDEVGAITMFNLYPGGSQEWLAGGTPYSTKGTWNRSGQNSMKKSTICRRYPGPMKLVSKMLPLGPRLPYKVINAKTGRPVWARRPIKIWKLVRDKSKVVSRKGESLTPNPLSYQEVIFAPKNNSRSLLANYPGYPGWQRVITGDLWENFQWPYASPLPFSPNLHAAQATLVPGRWKNDDEIALSKLYAKVKDQSVNLLNAIAERKQTVRMLGELIQKLLKALLMFKRGNFGGAANALLPGNHADVSDFWLMFVYGIKPLISDINGLVDHLNKYPPLEVDVKVGHESVQTLEEVSSTTSGVNCKAKKFTNSKVRVTYKVRLKLKDNWSRNFARLGLTNLNATAWELIPWSFIIDWALPIGEYLNNEDAFEGMEVVWCTRTLYSQETVSVNRQFGGRDNDGYVWEPGEAGFVVIKTHVERTLRSVPPLPSPSFKNPLSFQHGVNLLALISSLTR